MQNHFSAKLSQILAFSKEEAVRFYNTSIGPEHLLLAILREDVELMTILADKKGVNLADIKREMEDQLRQSADAHTSDSSEMISPDNINLNEQANNVLKLAILEARRQHKNTIDETHLILAILHDKTYNAAKVLLEQKNIFYGDAINVAEAVPKNTDSLFDIPEDEDGDPGVSRNTGNTRRNTQVHNGSNKSKTPVLDNFGVDLTKAAAEDKLDPMVGREKELQRVIEILCRRKKNNPVLIGEPGVGKSAIVEGLAQRIAKHQIAPILFGKRLVSLDLASLVAGTKYRGQFEERIKALVNELQENKDIILFIDEIHTLVGAGSSPDSMDAANILKPALARGELQCIGATTMDEYRNSIEKNGALERRFQKVLVEPTTIEETETILHNLKDRYEKYHHVTYNDEIIENCVKLAQRYVTDRFFPDKAIDVMDEAGSKVHLKTSNVPDEILEIEKQIEVVKEKKKQFVSSQNFEEAAAYRDKQVQLEEQLKEANERWNSGEDSTFSPVTESDVAEVVSIMTGVPVKKIAENEGEKLQKMSETLKTKVIAQDNAVDKIVKAIRRNRVGLRSQNRPIGVFMFLGPTGVGKTYLAKKIAEEMFGSADSIIRVDMSEYAESFTTSRLVGAPPGYVGYGEGGQLTEKVRRHPYSIVLLDEIEKANSAVFNLLLQVLDEGRMTDGNGRLVDFRNTIIIMTSNSGTQRLKDFAHGVGFNAAGISGVVDEKGKEYARSIIQKSLSTTFSPEFLNRLDEIITFDQLDMNAIKRIIDLELKDLSGRLEEMGYSINLTDKAKEFVATKGYDIQFGARPLKRAIQTYIEDGVCELILSGNIKKGDTINIGKIPNKEELTFTAQ